MGARPNELVLESYGHGYAEAMTRGQDDLIEAIFEELFENIPADVRRRDWSAVAWALAYEAGRAAGLEMLQ